jgi:hypothetical protein
LISVAGEEPLLTGFNEPDEILQEEKTSELISFDSDHPPTNFSNQPMNVNFIK